MARPVNANAEQTKRRILHAASELFADHGFDGTSVRQIAAGAGVSLGMIRHYFGSKEGLWKAVVSSHFTEYMNELEAQRDVLRALEQLPDTPTRARRAIPSSRRSLSSIDAEGKNV